MTEERENGGLATDDPVRVNRVRQLLASAAKAVRELETVIKELVTMRAWVLLGYKDLSTMWEIENGFRCPPYVKVLAVEAMAAEGMNTQRGGPKSAERNGHTQVDVSKAVGFPVQERRPGVEQANTVSSVLRQLGAGVPPQQVTVAKGAKATNAINLYGARARSQPRRMGKLPDEFVTESFSLIRRDSDAVAAIARDADVPKAEIFRQAVTQYLDRVRSVEQQEIDQLRANIEDRDR